MEAQTKDLLPIPYFHVVFTLPEALTPIVLQNKRAVYDLLFRAVAATLKQIALDAKYLGAKIGFLAVLHTKTQVPISRYGAITMIALSLARGCRPGSTPNCRATPPATTTRQIAIIARRKTRTLGRLVVAALSSFMISTRD